MNKIILLLLSTIYCFNVSAQTSFELTVNISNFDDIADIIETPSGDFVAVATIYNGTNYEITLIKFSTLGTVLSSKRIGTAQTEIAKSICNTADGGFFITGYASTSPSDNDALLIKVDSTFDVQFFKRYGNTPGNDYANEGFQTVPGTYTFTGTVAIGGSAKPSIVTLDSSGNVISQSYLNTNQFASPNYHGNYLGDGMVGFAHLANIITLLDTSGTLISDFSLSTGGFSTKVIKSNDGKFVALGVSGFGAPQGQGISICIGDTATGIFNIANGFNLNGADLQPAGIFQDAFNNYYVAGNINSLATGNSTPFVLKTDSAANTIWIKTYKPASTTSCSINNIIPTSDGGCMIAGTAVTGTNSDLFIAKISSGGSSSCNTTTIAITTNTLSTISATPHTPNAGIISPINVNTVIDTTINSIPNLLCLTTGLSNNAETSDNFIVFPTLFDRFIKIQTKDFYKEFEVNISDLEGRTVYKNRLFGNQEIDLNNLAVGPYIILIKSTDLHKVYTSKLIKYK